MRLPSLALRRRPSLNLYERDRHRDLNAAAPLPVALVIGFDLDQSGATWLVACPMTEQIKFSQASLYFSSGLIKRAELTSVLSEIFSPMTVRRIIVDDIRHDAALSLGFARQPRRLLGSFVAFD